MQYRIILFSLLIAAGASKAQTARYDTIITESGTIIRPAGRIIAVNMASNDKPVVYTAPPKPLPPKKVVAAPVAEKTEVKKDPKSRSEAKTESAVAAADKKGGYNHIPLAGEKAYFGEKNEYVNDFVRKYLELHNRVLGNVQNTGDHSFSVIDNVLEKKNMPKELKYLAVIESALNHNAVSHAGAVGPWQLMATTARGLGLKVSHKSDDRRDLYKSTTAATKYLELLYGQLNDWLLVIAAYNSGPVPVQRAIERTGSHNFWDIKEYLPRETQGHVLAFIATASIFENLSKFINLGSIPVDFKFGKEDDIVPFKDAVGAPVVAPSASPAGTAVAASSSAPKAAGTTKKTTFTEDELKNMTIVRITKPIYLEYMAQELGIDKKLLTRWNADYDMFSYGTYPTPYYNLRFPKDKQEVFLQKKEALTKRSGEIFAGLK